MTRLGKISMAAAIFFLFALCGVAQAAPAAPRLAAGGGHTCAILGNGTVQCWGDDGSGQLGDGLRIDRATPAPVPGLVGASAIATGAAHTCVALADGRVECWGDNRYGQLGDGSLRRRLSPVEVRGIASAVSVSAADHFSCALLRSGRVKCWGDDANGELGNGQTSLHRYSTPVLVRGLTNAVQLSSAGDHSCALVVSGKVKCWGSDPYGQLGYDTARAVTIRGIAGATAVASGGGAMPGNIAANNSEYSCAVVAEGRIRCWGDNRAEQLGTAIPREAELPVFVRGMRGATDVVAGVQHACAIFNGGSLACWGDNRAGELGTGSVSRSSPPVAVGGISGATGLAAGGNFGSAHTCALLSSGGIQCWGDNHYGQLGDGSTAQRSAPVAVLLASA
jgi:alpha-tubulin suppressor-like RCC1 family protein